MGKHQDVLIAGGGVIGLTTAYYLRRADASVTILDKGNLGSESSWAGAGILSPSPPVSRAGSGPELLAAHSNRLHPELAAELRESTRIDTGYIRCGGWALFGKDERPPIERWQNAGIECEKVSPAELARHESDLAPGHAIAVHFPTTAQLRNPRHVKALIGWCCANGVEVRPGCPVLGFERLGDRVTGVLTDSGVIHAGRVLLTAGAWSGGLLSSIGFACPVRPVRGQIALLNAATLVLRRIVERGRQYLVPRPDGRVLVGSTEEDAGFEKQTTTAGIASLLSFALELVPRLSGASVERCWAGLRPGSPDGLPFLGPVPGVENLYVAAGHFRSGLHLSPATGMVVKELLLGEPLSIPLEEFRLDRPLPAQAAFRFAAPLG